MAEARRGNRFGLLEGVLRSVCSRCNGDSTRRTQTHARFMPPGPALPTVPDELGDAIGAVDALDEGQGGRDLVLYPRIDLIRRTDGAPLEGDSGLLGTVDEVIPPRKERAAGSVRVCRGVHEIYEATDQTDGERSEALRLEERSD